MKEKQRETGLSEDEVVEVYLSEGSTSTDGEEKTRDSTVTVEKETRGGATGEIQTPKKPSDSLIEKFILGFSRFICMTFS